MDEEVDNDTKYTLPNYEKNCIESY